MPDPHSPSINHHYSQPATPQLGECKAQNIKFMEELEKLQSLKQEKELLELEKKLLADTIAGQRSLIQLTNRTSGPALTLTAATPPQRKSPPQVRLSS